MRNKILTLFMMAVAGSVMMNAQILYKIEKPGSENASYLFGSHHMAPISVVEESGAMDYFNQAAQVVGEIDLTQDPMMISMALQPYMMAPADSTLSVLLQGEDIDALNATFSKYSPMPGMTLQMLDPLKPNAVSAMMAAGMSQEEMPGFDPAQQLDSFFFKTGAQEGKKIVALETPEYQGEVLFNMTPLTIQADGLIEMLKNPEESLEMARKLTKAYQDRNLDAMYEVSKQGDQNPEFMELLLTKRNADWMTKLPALIDESPAFIVVGALHLAGPEGLLQQLQNAGYKISPIY